jgi:hypothetical protein
MVTESTGSAEIENVILDLVRARGPDKSICPTEAAQALDPVRWRGRLGDVRASAIRLAQAGAIDILRKGKPVNPTDFRGVYRLRLKVYDPA